MLISTIVVDANMLTPTIVLEDNMLIPTIMPDINIRRRLVGVVFPGG